MTRIERDIMLDRAPAARGRPTRPGPRRRGAAAATALAAVLALAACDVTNPGPIQDDFLVDPQSHQPFVSGAGHKLLQALMVLGYDGGVVVREFISSGQVGAHGWDIPVQFGYIEPGSFGGDFGLAQEARWIAEEAIRRLSPADVEAEPRILAEAYNWAGYANRVLGDNYCEAVIDGGPAEPGIRYFERAEEHFTRAIELATTAGEEQLALAATAGRAQVRLWLEDWAGAMADARAVPDGFTFQLKTDATDEPVRNMFFWGSTYTGPYRNLSVWKTFFEVYYQETGDPRTPWTTHPEIEYSVGALAGFGQVPYQLQLKHAAGDDPIRLAGAREMRLVEAEALLQTGAWQQAMDVINDMRVRLVSDHSGQPLEPWVAASAEEAWTLLKRERAIELWMEGRRLGDVRRWMENGAPGAIDWPDFESLSSFYDTYDQSYCFDIPDSERDANPNIPSVG